MKILGVVLFFLLGPMAFAVPAKLRVGAELLMPYMGFAEKSKPTGYVFDILEEFSKKNSYKFEYVEIPLMRQVQALEKGEIDYAILPNYLVRYLPDVEIISASLGVSYAGALVDEKVPMEALYDLSDLAGKTVILSYLGPTTDALRADLLKQAGKKTDLVEISGADISQRMMLMMLNKRGDIALGDYSVLRYTAASNSAAKLRVIPTSLIGFGSVVLVARKNESGYRKMNEQLADWLQSARRSGRLNLILKKYNLNDWENLLGH